ncbi:MAG: HAMP domain-containing histidine kinase, partial [Oscillospiraceae bacterium]|nr:HAMP domain-containing histidine kinase [Oscillospiraceae bacterium]
MKKSKTVTLKWRIFAFLLGFCALLLGILWLFQTVFLNDMYKHIRKQELNRAVSEVEKNINHPDLAAFLDWVGYEYDIIVLPTIEFITIFPPHGVWQRQPYPPDSENRIEFNSPPEVMFGVRSPFMSQGFDVITEDKVFSLENGGSISLTFHAVLSPVDATVSTIRLQLYIITGVMIVLSVALAIIIAKRVSKPIEEINKSSLELAKGNYGVRFGGRGFREIAELSETLNTAASELGRVESLRRELLANVSHDLRTPLALIYSYAEMMSDFPDEITSEQTKTIMDESKRLTTLVNDALDLSKLESDLENNEESLNKSRFNLTENIAGTVGRVSELLKNKDFVINFERDGENINEDVQVVADETKIDRAFYNLLINAVNYSGDSHEITVTQTVYDNGDKVRISVIDNGEGISEEDLPQIWDRYYKSGKTHKRAVTGTGLGLSIVKKIVELHGGVYGVESEI